MEWKKGEQTLFWGRFHLFPDKTTMKKYFHDQKEMTYINEEEMGYI
jgi:hypothetical protein